jgi:hypothetical protein
MTQFNQCGGENCSIRLKFPPTLVILTFVATLFANLRPYDMRLRDVFAVIALALSGFSPEVMVVAGALIWISARWTVQVKALATLLPLAIFCVSVSLPDRNGDAAFMASTTGIIVGFLLAGHLMSRPAQPLDLLLRPRRSSAS